MLISFFEGNSPGLDFGNLKVAEGLADGYGICPLRCLVLQDSPRGPFAVGERSQEPIGGFVFGGWFPAEWTEQVIVDNYPIEVGIHRVLGGRWRGQALVTRSAVLHGFYRGNLRFGWLGFRFWCEDHPAADAECNTECNAEYGEESGDGLLHQRYLYLKGDPGADRMSTPGFSVVCAVRGYGVIPIKMETEMVLCLLWLEPVGWRLGVHQLHELPTVERSSALDRSATWRWWVAGVATRSVTIVAVVVIGWIARVASRAVTIVAVIRVLVYEPANARNEGCAAANDTDGSHPCRCRDSTECRADPYT